MKRVVMVMMAAMFLFACHQNTDKGNEVTGTDQEKPGAEWVVVTLDVEGMTCEGCEKAINTSVGTLPGIAEVESSHEGKFTRVKFDKSVTSLEEIAGKITETGYEVKGERSTPES